MAKNSTPVLVSGRGTASAQVDATASTENNPTNNQISAATPREAVQHAVPAQKPLTEAAQEKALEEAAKKQELFSSDTLGQASQLAAGARRQVQSDQRALDGMGVWDRISGSKGALEAQKARDEQAVVDRDKHEAELRKALEQSQQLLAAAKKEAEEVRALRAAGKEEQARILEKHAQILTEQSVAKLSGSAIDVTKEKAAMQHLQELSEQLSKVTDRLDTTITVATYTQEGCNLVVVIGASCIAGPEAGAAVNLALKSAENGLGEGMNVYCGNKSADRAWADFKNHEKGVAVESAVMLVAGGAGRAAGMLTKGAGLATKVAVSGGAGLAIGAGAEGANVAMQLHSLNESFDKEHPNLTGAERESAWQRYREANGLSNGRIAFRLTVAGATNAVAAGAGAGIGHASQAVTNKVSQAATKVEQSVVQKVGGVLAGSQRAVNVTSYVVNVGSNVAQLGLTGNLNGAAGVQNSVEALAWGAAGLHGEHGIPGRRGVHVPETIIEPHGNTAGRHSPVAPVPEVRVASAGEHINSERVNAHSEVKVVVERAGTGGHTSEAVGSAPKTQRAQLSKVDENLLYRELEKKLSPAALDDLFVKRRNQNGGALTEQDVRSACKEAGCDVPDLLKTQAEVRAAQRSTGRDEHKSDSSLVDRYTDQGGAGGAGGGFSDRSTPGGGGGAGTWSSPSDGPGGVAVMDAPAVAAATKSSRSTQTASEPEVPRLKRQTAPETKADTKHTLATVDGLPDVRTAEVLVPDVGPNGELLGYKTEFRTVGVDATTGEQFVIESPEFNKLIESDYKPQSSKETLATADSIEKRASSSASDSPSTTAKSEFEKLLEGDYKPQQAAEPEAAKQVSPLDELLKGPIQRVQEIAPETPEVQAELAAKPAKKAAARKAAQEREETARVQSKAALRASAVAELRPDSLLDTSRRLTTVPLVFAKMQPETAPARNPPRNNVNERTRNRKEENGGGSEQTNPAQKERKEQQREDGVLAQAKMKVADYEERQRVSSGLAAKQKFVTRVEQDMFGHKARVTYLEIDPQTLQKVASESLDEITVKVAEKKKEVQVEKKKKETEVKN